MRAFPHRLIGSALGCLLAATLAVLADAAMPPAAPPPVSAPQATQSDFRALRAELQTQLELLRRTGADPTALRRMEALIERLLEVQIGPP